MRLPVIPLNKVFHVGSMDAENVGVNGPSFEGRCLSVSLCPNAWVQIAEISGELHALRRDEGLFLDVHAALADAEIKDAIVEWALERGLVEARTLWKTWRYDDEIEDWTYMLNESRDGAFAEIEGEGDWETPEEAPGPEEHEGIEPVEALVGVGALEAITGIRCRADEDATDAMVMAWAMCEADAALGRPVDGLWWRETYDPGTLSAPRGAVFPERVDEWKARKRDIDVVDDLEELAKMPETEFNEEVSLTP